MDSDCTLLQINLHTSN